VVLRCSLSAMSRRCCLPQTVRIVDGNVVLRLIRTDGQSMDEFNEQEEDPASDEPPRFQSLLALPK